MYVTLLWCGSEFGVHAAQSAPDGRGRVIVKFCLGSRAKSAQSGLYSSSVGKLDQAGSPASACTGLYRQKGKKNPGDTGSQPKHLHIKGDI
jgi:hypothetical protein